MDPVFQDITITLELTNMTKEKYDKIIKTLDKISTVGRMSTLTYNQNGSELLNDEQKEHVTKLWND